MILRYSRIPDIEEVRSIADLVREVNGGTLPTTNKDIEQLKSEVASPSIITVTLNADVEDPIQFRRVYQFETLLLNDPKINSVDSIVELVVSEKINSEELSNTLLKIPQEVKDLYQNKKSDKIALDFYTDDITGKQVSALTEKIQQTAQFVGLGIAGFGVLIFSIIPVLFDFGKSIVLSLGFSFVAAFFVLPPLLLLLDPNKVKKNKEVNL